MENVWEFLRDNRIAAQVWETYAAIVRDCSKAWNWFSSDPHRNKSTGTREWVVPAASETVRHPGSVS